MNFELNILQINSNELRTSILFGKNGAKGEEEITIQQSYARQQPGRARNANVNSKIGR